MIASFFKKKSYYLRGAWDSSAYGVWDCKGIERNEEFAHVAAIHQ